MAKCFIEYRNEWRDEIVKHFGTVYSCAKVCKLSRPNLQKTISGNTGYISENMLITICKEMDIAPICFLDNPYHSAYYNDHYKLSYREYKQLCITDRISIDPVTSIKYEPINIILKLTAGLTDEEIRSLSNSTKTEIFLKIMAVIDPILKNNLPDWNSLNQCSDG